MFQCVSVDHIHAKCRCVLLLLSVHVIHSVTITVTVKVGVTFSFGYFKVIIIIIIIIITNLYSAFRSEDTEVLVVKEWTKEPGSHFSNYGEITDVLLALTHRNLGPVWSIHEVQC